MRDASCLEARLLRLQVPVVIIHQGLVIITLKQLHTHACQQRAAGLGLP